MNDINKSDAVDVIIGNIAAVVLFLIEPNAMTASALPILLALDIMIMLSLVEGHVKKNKLSIVDEQPYP